MRKNKEICLKGRFKTIFCSIKTSRAGQGEKPGTRRKNRLSAKKQTGRQTECAYIGKRENAQTGENADFPT